MAGPAGSRQKGPGGRVAADPSNRSGSCRAAGSQMGEASSRASKPPPRAARASPARPEPTRAEAAAPRFRWTATPVSEQGLPTFGFSREVELSLGIESAHTPKLCRIDPSGAHDVTETLERLALLSRGLYARRRGASLRSHRQVCRLESDRRAARAAAGRG